MSRRVPFDCSLGKWSVEHQARRIIETDGKAKLLEKTLSCVTQLASSPTSHWIEPLKAAAKRAADNHLYEFLHRMDLCALQAAAVRSSSPCGRRRRKYRRTRNGCLVPFELIGTERKSRRKRNSRFRCERIGTGHMAAEVTGAPDPQKCAAGHQILRRNTPCRQRLPGSDG